MKMRIGQRDNLVQLYEETPTSGTLGSTTMAWVAGDREWAGFIPSFLTRRNYGAGEAPTGTREIQFRAPSDVGDRFGLEVVRGPEEGTKWRVRSVDRDRKVVNVLVEPFTGDFT